MRPDNLTIFGLFERQQRYVVPLFQRPYVWSKEKQWEAFWEDISDKAEQVLEKGLYHTGISRHFLGALVLNSERQEGFQVPIKLVIDGQQRITTIQVMMLALRDFAKKCDARDIVNNLELLTTNRISNIKTEELYKVWPTDADQEIFTKLFNAGSVDMVKLQFPLYYRLNSSKPEPRPKLVEAYLFFYELIESFVAGPEETELEESTVNRVTPQDRIKALYDGFINCMEFVTIDLSEGDNPQEIFESLNYLGEPLLPSDLIRNFVFLEANRLGEPTRSLYKQYWYIYDKPGNEDQPGFWKYEEKQGRLKRPRLDLFVFHYLTFLRGEELIITRLYKEFQNWWKEEKDRSVKKELEKLQKFSNIYLKFIKPEGETRMDVFINRLRDMEMSTAYPLLLYLLSDQVKLSKNELNDMAVDLESYLVRRMICGLSPKNYNKIFLSILTRLRKSSEVTREQLQQFLLEPQGDTARWPGDDEFRLKWISQPIYRTNRARVPMVLLALNQQMMTKNQEDIIVLDKPTIEHILPQKYSTKDYPFPAGTGLDETQLKIRRNDILHTIGNLTLLTKALNARVSNGPFKNKKPLIAEQSSLRLNVYFQSQDLSDLWNEVSIQERGERLFDYAIRIWPYPC